MINPMQLLGMMRSGNPAVVMMQAAKQNPVLAQAMQMVNGKTPAEMRELAQNLAHQHGIDINQVAHQLGIKLPF